MSKKQKFYAVKNGRVPGIYLSWEECKKNVDGFSGAIYKSFPDRAEAEAYMGTEVLSGTGHPLQTGAFTGSNQPPVTAPLPEADSLAGTSPLTGTGPEGRAAAAYVDGSYNVSTGEYSYGAVIFFKGSETHFSDKFSDPEMASMRNVAGEIEGAQKAMAYCLENSIEELDLYYDYEGIRAWPTGLWKANKEGTKKYRAYYESIKDRLKVNFLKVKAHTGVTYNELADRLAKGALGLL